MKKLPQLVFAAALISMIGVTSNPNRAAAQGATADATIIKNLEAQFAGHEVSKTSNITVKSTQGVVTLSGTARSLAAKDEVGDLAKKLTGVKSVSNDVQIVQVPDATILAEINTAFSAHALAKAAKITAASAGGVVTLSGTASSLAAKEEAGDLAKKADGAKSLSNNVQVAAVPDPNIVAAINSTIAAHDVAKKVQVNAASAQGVVTLNGTANSMAAKDEVGDLAKKVSGVKVVSNNVQIVEVPDSKILADINALFAANGVAKVAQINVTVVHGAVTLTGTAQSPAARDEAEDLAKKQGGVQSVVNNVIARL